MDTSFFSYQTLENIGGYLSEERHNILKTFNIRDKNLKLFKERKEDTCEIKSFKRIVNLLSEILRSWNGAEIKSCPEGFRFHSYFSPPPFVMNIDNTENIIHHIAPSLLLSLNEEVQLPIATPYVYAVVGEVFYSILKKNMYYINIENMGYFGTYSGSKSFQCVSISNCNSGIIEFSSFKCLVIT